MVYTRARRRVDVGFFRPKISDVKTGLYVGRMHGVPLPQKLSEVPNACEASTTMYHDRCTREARILWPRTVAQCLLSS